MVESSYVKQATVIFKLDNETSRFRLVIYIYDCFRKGTFLYFEMFFENRFVCQKITKVAFLRRDYILEIGHLWC